MKKWPFFLSTILVFSAEVFAEDGEWGPSLWSTLCNSVKGTPAKDAPRSTDCCKTNAYGWSLDLGGQYTWMSFTTPPTFSGSTGGVVGKLTYQKPDSFFGQLRSIYNNGRLVNSSTTSSDNEWYTEFVSGYTFGASCWTFTPYVGVGLDFLNDHKKAYSTFTAINLHYRTYYAIAGFDTRYTWQNCYLGLQAECLPVFHQYLAIGGLAGEAWTMSDRIGVAGRLPIGAKITQKIWVEVTPYYRYFPIGSSHVLNLDERNLTQIGGFVTFRFFL